MTTNQPDIAGAVELALDALTAVATSAGPATHEGTPREVGLAYLIVAFAGRLYANDWSAVREDLLATAEGFAADETLWTVAPLTSTGPTRDDIVGDAVALMLAMERNDAGAVSHILDATDPYALAATLGGMLVRLGPTAAGSPQRWAEMLAAWRPGTRLGDEHL